MPRAARTRWGRSCPSKSRRAPRHDHEVCRSSGAGAAARLIGPLESLPSRPVRRPGRAASSSDRRMPRPRARLVDRLARTAARAARRSRRSRAPNPAANHAVAAGMSRYTVMPRMRARPQGSSPISSFQTVSAASSPTSGDDERGHGEPGADAGQHGPGRPPAADLRPRAPSRRRRTPTRTGRTRPRCRRCGGSGSVQNANQ